MRSGIRGGGAVRPFSILLGFLALSLALAGCRRRGAEETEEGAAAGELPEAPDEGPDDGGAPFDGGDDGDDGPADE